MTLKSFYCKTCMALKASVALRGECLRGRGRCKVVTRQRLGVIMSPAVPSHRLLGLGDNPQPSRPLSRFLGDTQPWQVASHECRSVLCVHPSEWSSK